MGPTFTKGFFQGLGATPQLTIAADGTTTATLRFTITNTNVGTPLTNIAFTDTLPAGLLVATPNGVLGTCGGAVTASAVAGSNLITLTGGSLAAAPGPFNFCSFVVNVVAPTTTAPGLLTNLTGTLTATAGNTPVTTAGATAAITVTALPAPMLTKSFSTGVGGFIPVGGTSVLTLTLTNPNAAALTGLAFTDTLPVGVTLAVPNLLATTCGGVVNATAPNLITLTGTTLAGNASCSITVNVTGNTAGVLTNTTSTVTSTNGLTGGVATAPITIIPTDAFQVRYAANLALGDSVVNITNAGSGSTIALPTQNGNLCVNAYVFSPDEQLVSCCTCLVTPNGLASLSANNDLVNNTLTPGRPTSVVIKLLASSQATCNASTVTPASIAAAGGLVAFGTTIHPTPVTVGTPAGTLGVTETPFTRSTLSPAELTRITTLCGFIQITGSGFGVCRACRLGGLGAERQ